MRGRVLRGLVGETSRHEWARAGAPGVRRGPGGMCDARAAARACVPSRVMLRAVRVREGVIRWAGRFAPFFCGLLSWCRTYLDGPGRGGLAGPSPHQTGRWLVTPQALVTRRNHPARCPPPAQCCPLLYDLQRICPLVCVRCVHNASRSRAGVVYASCVPLSAWRCGSGGGGAWCVVRPRSRRPGGGLRASHLYGGGVGCERARTAVLAHVLPGLSLV